MENDTSPTTWPDLAIGLYDRLTERNAEIIYEVENLDILIPNKTGADTERAKWTINGVMKIRTRDHGK